MSKASQAQHETHATGDHGSLRSYIIGFTLSIALTLTSYFLVSEHAMSRQALLAAILVLAVTQFVVQMIFFLHVANESKPRLNLMTFWFMLVVLALVVFGSLWIMKNLNYHMSMSPEETDQYIIKDELIDPNSSQDSHDSDTDMPGMDMHDMEGMQH